MDEARESDNLATLRVLEAEVARRQLELDADEDEDSDDNGSSSPRGDDAPDVDMLLKDGDYRCVPIRSNTISLRWYRKPIAYLHMILFSKVIGF